MHFCCTDFLRFWDFWHCTAYSTFLLEVAPQGFSLKEWTKTFKIRYNKASYGTVEHSCYRQCTWAGIPGHSVGRDKGSITSRHVRVGAKTGLERVLEIEPREGRQCSRVSRFIFIQYRETFFVLLKGTVCFWGVLVFLISLFSCYKR